MSDEQDWPLGVAASPTDDRPVTTTISTIAVQSGNTRIVIALLQSKEWLQLKIQEMHPAMTEVGANLEDVVELQKQHEQALEKLQTKQSPVEELLNQADELIASQRPRAEVYSAMADNLGLAWKDLNAQLEQRRMILDQAVLFHTRAREFSERMDRAYSEFNDTYMPDDAETCKNLLQRLHDAKKGILEGSMRTLNEGQALLSFLCEVGTHSMGDSRPVHMQHAARQSCSFVEQFMEALHDRRRHLEALWLQRKIKLEQCLQKCLIYHDLNQIEDWLGSRGSEYRRQTNLGDSSANAEILQHEHSKVEADSKEIQDRAIRLLRTAEQLSASGHYAAEEILNRAYNVMALCTELLDALNNRRQLLSSSVSFFNLAQTALNKLDQIEVQITTLDYPRTSAQLVQQHTQLLRAIQEITSPALQEGHDLLNCVGSNEPGAKGILKKVKELEDKKVLLSGMCTSHQTENQERSASYTKFINQYNLLITWITKNGQSFLQGHQDMGSVFSMAKDFLERHERLQNDVRIKGMEVEALLGTVPSLIQDGGPEADEIHQKADDMRNAWNSLRTALEIRIQLARRYLAFHKVATQLTKDMDAVEEAMKSSKEKCTESGIKQMEEKWVSVQQLGLQVNNTGRNFIEDAYKVDDSHLDVQRSILCVETLLEQFQNRKNALSTLWADWLSQLAEGKEQRVQWEHFVTDAHRTVQSVSTLETEIFPIIPKQMNCAETIADFLERHSDMVTPKMKHIQTEMEVRMRTSEMLGSKTEVRQQFEKITTELSQTYQQFHSRVSDYHVLISMMITFFRNLVELEKLLKKQENHCKMAILPSEVSHAETILREHQASKPPIMEVIKFANNEAAQLINKINSVEPGVAAAQDRDKIKMMLENKQQEFETMWEAHKHRLEQNVQFCQFNQDLRTINEQIEQLQNHLLNMKGNYGESLPAAKATSQAFVQFERTLEILERRIQQFVSTAEKMLDSQHMESHSIRIELGTLQTKWSTFHMKVGENRHQIDLAIDYFQLVEEAEEWFREGSKILIEIARKSTSCKTSEEATSLLSEVEKFLKPGELKQEERIEKISALATQLYGMRSHSSILKVTGRNREMLDSFATINSELFVLAENLKEAAVVREREKKEKEETVTALKAAHAEATAAKAAATAAQEAAKAAEAAVKAIPPAPERVEKVTVSQQTAIPIPSYPVKIVEQPPVPLPRAPVFVMLLADAEVLEGSKVIFECRVDGYPTPYIQWLKDGILIQNNPDYVTSYENGVCTLTIEETFAEDSAGFTCKATNGAGIAETHGKLTVKESRPHEELIPPHFVKEIQPSTVREGQCHQFECQVGGHPLPLVTWFKNDTCVDNHPDYSVSCNNGTCVLTIERARLTDDARYSCRATNQAGQVACSAKLTVLPLSSIHPPVFTSPLSNVMARAGQKLRLECSVMAEPEPTILWLHNNKPIKENRDVKLQFEENKATLVITEAFPKDAGTYIAVARNQAGEATSSCNVSVKGRLPLETSDSEMASDMEPVKPEFKEHLINRLVSEGSQVRLDCVVIGQPEPEVIWYHNTKPVKESDDFQLLFEGDRCTLIIKEAYLEDAGMYKCVAINSGGEAASQCVVTVESPKDISKGHDQLIIENTSAPRFLTLLTDKSVTEGQRVLLECKVTGAPQPFVTWFKNNKQIDSSNECQIKHESDGSVQLIIPEATVKDSSSYVVKASNKSGEAKCFCNLTVKPKPTSSVIVSKPNDTPPVFQKYIEDVRVIKGSQAKFECIVTGNPKPKTRWFFRNWPLQADQNHVISESGDTHTLTISQVRALDAGRYSITAENIIGKATSAALLALEEPSQDVISWDSVNERKVHSMVMSKKTMMVQQSTLSKVVNESEKGSYEIHQMSALEQHSYSKVGDQPADEFSSSQRSELHQVDGCIPEFRPLTLPSILSGEATRTQKTTTTEVVQSAAPSRQHVSPKFTKPVTSALVEKGEKIYLEGQIEGYPEPSVKWFKNGIELFSKPGRTLMFSGNVTSLEISKSEETDTARYTCTASNDAGSASSSADVIVKVHRVPPKFTKRLDARLVKSGERVELSVKVEGIPTPEIHWSRNGTPLQSSPDFRIKSEGKTHSIVIPEAFPEDSGKLIVRAVNEAGEAICTADLLVEEEIEQIAYTVVEQSHKHITHLSSSVQSTDITSTEEMVSQIPEVPPKPVEAKVVPVPPPKPVAPVEAKIWSSPKLVESAQIAKVVEQYTEEIDEIPEDIEEPKEETYTQEKFVTTERFIKEPVWKPAESVVSSTSTTSIHSREVMVKQEEVVQPPKVSPKPIIKKETPNHSPKPKKEVVIEEIPVVGMPVRPPEFTKNLADVTAIEQQTVILECHVDGAPVPQIRWFCDNRQIAPSLEYQIDSEHGICTLTIAQICKEDAGKYTCTATNVGGSRSCSAQLLVEPLVNKGQRSYNINITNIQNCFNRFSCFSIVGISGAVTTCLARNRQVAGSSPTSARKFLGSGSATVIVVSPIGAHQLPVSQDARSGNEV